MKIRSFTAASLIAASLLFAASACAAPRVRARAAMVMNLRSESVLFVQDIDRRIPPASLAKIMTMYVVFDQIAAGRADLTRSVRVSEHAASTRGATMGLRAGEILTLGELIKGVAAASGNDASVAVAEHIAGSEKKFVAMMNAKAKTLGLKDTRFTNPHGLPPAQGQWSTARDLLTLTKRYMEDHPEAMPYHSILAVTHGGTTTTNKNRLLTTCEGVDGVKTGWIRESGHHLITTAQRGAVRVLCVLLGAEDNDDCLEESSFLIEAAFTTVASGGERKIIHQLRDREGSRD